MRLSTPDLCDLFTAHGWTLRPGGYGMGADSPFNEWERPTPAWAQEKIVRGGVLVPATYPFPTYRPYYRVWWLVRDGKRYAQGFRSAPAPWVRVSDVDVTNVRLAALIEQWGAAGLAADRTVTGDV